MKKYMLLLIMAISYIPLLAQKNGDLIVGKWKNSTGEAHIQIYKKKDMYFGKLAWLKNPNNANGAAKTDINNPDEKLRTRPLMDLEILTGFKYTDDDTWEDGKIYDPKSGKVYSCKMTLDDNKLNVRGYVGVSLLGRTDVWTKVN